MVKHRGDDICGVLLLDKPTGRSSNFYLQRIKYLFNAKKAGHTGSLDPLATGLLPVCFGKATCISEYFLHSEKSYEAVIQLGVTTDSHDCDGEVVERREVDVSNDQLQKALEQFRGDIEQVPPMVSALKYQGQPLYKLALKGKEVERKARKMTVYSLSAELIYENKARLQVHCSSGFYVRQLAADLGEALGCGAHIVELRRTTSKYLDVANTIPYDELVSFFEVNGEELDKTQEEKTVYIESLLLAPDELLKSLPALFVNRANAEHVSHGRKIALTETSFSSYEGDNAEDTNLSHDINQHYRLYQSTDSGSHFLGIAEITHEQTIKVRRLFNEFLSEG